MPYFKIPSDKLIALTPLPLGIRVKYKDIFDLKGFYEWLHEWLLEHNYKDQAGDEDHWETFHFERVWPGNVKEIYLHWRCMRKAKDGPFMYYLDFNWHCIGITKAEIVRDGHKLSLDKGEVELYIGAYVEELYKDFFDKINIPFVKDFKKLFATRVYDETVEFRRKELYHELYVLQNDMKNWFKLKRHLPYDESKLFLGSKAYPSHLKE